MMNIHDINFLQDNLKKKKNYDGKNGKGKMQQIIICHG